MTLILKYQDDQGLTHEHRGAVMRALDQHLDPDRVTRLFDRIAAAGGPHDPTLCERCRAVAAVEARKRSEQYKAELQAMLRRENVPALKREDGSAIEQTGAALENLRDSESWWATRDEYLTYENACDPVTGMRLHDQDCIRVVRRRMRDLTARVKACNRGELPGLLTRIRSDAKRCKELSLDPMVSVSCRQQAKALGAVYTICHDMGLERMFGRVPEAPKVKPKRVRSTPRSLGMMATYEPVCSCGHGYIH